MNFKRKIKKAIKNLPVQSFEEWRAAHPELDIYFAPEPAPKKRKTFPKWIYAPASFLLIAAIVLPIVLSNVLGGTGTPPGTLPPITNEIVSYGADDIDKAPIGAEYIADKAEILLFDLDKILDEYSVTKEFPIDTPSMDISYILSECFVPLEINGQMQAFYVTYRIRVYEHYNFVNERYYADLENDLKVGEYMINYQINKTQSITEGFAYFTHNKNDYYIYIKEAQSVWPLTDAASQALLQHLFAN